VGFLTVGGILTLGAFMNRKID